MIWTVAKREILVRSRTKVFRVITALLLVAAVAGVIASTVIDGDGDELPSATIGTVAIDPTLRAQVTETAPDIVEVEYVNFAGFADAEIALASGDVDVVFAAAENSLELVWDREANYETQSVIRTAVQQVAMTTNAANLSLAPTDLEQLFQPAEINERFLDEFEDGDGIKTIVALIGIVGTVILIQVWGSLVAMGVIEEKASRVVEVLLSHISPRELMTGKILGLGILAIAQALVVLGGLLTALLLVRDVEVPAEALSSIPLILGCIVTGFAFYSAAFGAAGSLVSRTEDAQQVMLPVMLPMFIGYALTTASVGNPDSTLIKVISFIPFTMPVALPLRAAAGAIAPWEVGVAFASIIAATFLMTRLAARLYEFALLRTGSRIGWSEALRLATGRAT